MEVTLNSILISILKSFPSTWPSRPNSFAVIDSMADIDTDNLSATIRDGLILHYWGRSWEASGMNPSKIEFENACVFLKYNDATFSGSSVCFNIDIGIASLPTCEVCTRDRNSVEIQRDNAHTLSFILNQLMSIECYNADIPASLGGHGVDRYMITRTHSGYLIGNGVNLSNKCLNNCDDFDLKLNRNDINTFKRAADGTIISVANITVCECYVDPIMNYTNITIPSYSEAKCSTC